MPAIPNLGDDTRPGGLLSTVRRGGLAPLAAIAVVAVALGLRLYGLDWDRGYDHTPHPDERAILGVVGRIAPPSLSSLGSLLDAEDSPWNPKWFPYGSFPLYLLKGVALTYEMAAGEGLSDLRVAGRALSAVADAVTVLLVLVLGSRLFGRRVGLLASLFAALAVIHIQLSHFFAVDTMLSLFAVASIYFTYRIAAHGRLRDSAFAGILVGLGLATKASMLPIYGALIVAHVMFAFAALGDREPASRGVSQRWRTAAMGLATAVAVSGLAVFLVQPYMFLDWDRFYGSFVEQSEMVRRIRDYPYTRQYVDTTPYLYHVRQLATWGLGWPLGIVAWAGLLYASVNGMRWRVGVAYLLLGWGAPIALLLLSQSLPAIVLASAIALLALIGTLPLRSERSRQYALMLAWVVPYLIITGSYQVKFLRYMLPVTPFLLLFGASMLADAWERWGRPRPRIRPWMIAGLAALVGATAFYALSYVSLYARPHPAVRASEWLIENARPGSFVLKEHWEESLPDLGRFPRNELPMYEADGPRKTRLLSDALSRADYLVFYSNRLYGTLPRLPERYPLSTGYYRELFSGGLGYELVVHETSYPSLAGVSFVDDTFRRPGVPAPDPPQGSEPSGLRLGLGFADESFTVYDHPKVLVFENTKRHDAETIRLAIERAAPVTPPAPSETRAPATGLMMSEEQAAAQRRGGTWSEIVSEDGWTGRYPLLAWLIVVQGVALLTVPIAFVVFRPLPDRGYLFSKVLGLLLVGFTVWLLASLRWMAFSTGSIAVALTVLAAASSTVLLVNRRDIAAFVRDRWRTIAVGEAVFLAAFLAFVAIRMANPDLWHPFRGGEKPMDFAYLNAVLRSSYMPPYDPWFGGGYLNYYYWGQFIVATLIRATGLDPAVAFNLAVPLFFALTASCAYAIVYNLAEATRSRALRVRGAPTRGEPAGGGRRFAWSPIAAGLAAALFVTVLGNLDGAVQLGEMVWRVVAENLPFGGFDFWRSSRMMPPDPPGHEITEFPFFTFLFADLHAHMMSIPFALLAFGLALTLLTGAIGKDARRMWTGPGEPVRLAVLGLAIGSLWVLNTWDLPVYLAIGVGSVLLAELVRQGGPGLGMAARAAAKSVLVLAVGYAAYLPFHLSYETFFTSVEATTNRTVLWQFLAIHGLFVFVVASFLAYELRDWLQGLADAVRSAYRTPARTLIVLAGVLALGLVVAGVIWGVLPSTITVLAVLLAVLLVALVRRLAGDRADSPFVAFVDLTVCVALVLAIGLDVWRVEGDIERMNTVFKFYIHVWIVLALASAYMLWRLYDGSGGALMRPGWGRKLWTGALVLLLVSASVYPVLGTHDRLRDRFYGRTTALTLNGGAFIEGTMYLDRAGEIDLQADYQGIEWLKRNVRGSPVVLEAVTPTYRWGGRVSIHTGLPSVVGWMWHQQQQRWAYRDQVGRRTADVQRIYETPDMRVALDMLDRYSVEYVYVGQVERLYYHPDGLAKFEEAVELERVFHTDQVDIYRVLDGR